MYRQIKKLSAVVLAFEEVLTLYASGREIYENLEMHTNKKK